MIPKKIHYIWFGSKAPSAKESFCIESWKKILPDYQIIRWDDTCLDKFDNLYFKQALEQKQYAFASDYARLKILYEEGGIYMDTDEEVLRPLDKFLIHDFFMGCQSCGSARGLSPALVGAVPHNQIIKDLLDVYNSTPFINPDGSLNRTTNPVYFADVLTKKYNIPTTYLKKGQIEFYPNSFLYDYFHFAKQGKDSYAVHHYAGNWKPDWNIKDKFEITIFGTHYIIRKYKKNRETLWQNPAKDEKLVLKIQTSKKSFWTLIKKRCSEKTWNFDLKEFIYLIETQLKTARILWGGVKRKNTKTKHLKSRNKTTSNKRHSAIKRHLKTSNRARLR